MTRQEQGGYLRPASTLIRARRIRMDSVAAALRVFKTAALSLRTSNRSILAAKAGKIGAHVVAEAPAPTSQLLKPQAIILMIRGKAHHQ